MLRFSIGNGRGLAHGLAALVAAAGLGQSASAGNGACCLCDLSCADITQEECEATGGMFNEGSCAGVTCEPFGPCPPGCIGSGVGMDLMPLVDGQFPPGGVVHIGDMIQFVVTLTQPLPPGCDYFQGQLSVTFPDGTRVNVAGYPGTDPVPSIGFGTPGATFVLDDLYEVMPGDPELLVTRADYGPTTNQPTQEPGTVLSSPPTPANSATIAFPLTLMTGECIPPPPTVVECLEDVPACPTTMEEFIEQGGMFTGNCGKPGFTVACSDTGACCLSDGSCAGNTTLVECEKVLGGTFQGEGTTCTMNLCSPGQPAECPGRITRSFTVIDVCQNEFECGTQNITIFDGEPPVITCPPNLVLECTGPDPAGDVPPPATDLASFLDIGGMVTDNCLGDIIIERVEPDVIDAGCPTIVSRTYRAVDGCGNESFCTQKIFLQDTTPPTITFCPENGNIDCDDDPPSDAAMATDICDPSPVVEELEPKIVNGSCPGKSVIVRTFVARDACGNEATCTQTILINDSTPPVITCPPDANIDCPQKPALPAMNLEEFLAQGGMVTDNCDPEVEISLVSETITGTCPQAIVRVYEARDDCDNVDVCTQVILVNDELPPMIECPEKIDINIDNGLCGQAVPFEVTAGDDCSEVEITCAVNPPNALITVVETGPGTFTVTASDNTEGTIVCTAEDACGNESTCSIDVNVLCHIPCSVAIDVQGCIVPPPLPPPPANSCEGDLEALTLLYTGDDCSATNHTQHHSQVDCDDYVVPLPDTVYIRVSNKASMDDHNAVVYFEGLVASGTGFDATATYANESEMDTNTYVHILDGENGDILQEVEFHSSCSQPLTPGNQFGSLVVMSMTSTEGGTADLPVQSGDCLREIEVDEGVVVEVVWTYTVTNTDAEVVIESYVVADGLGNVFTDAHFVDPGPLAPGESAVLTFSTFLMSSFTNVAEVTGNPGPNECTDMDDQTITINPGEPPIACRLTGGSHLNPDNFGNRATTGGQIGAPTAEQPQPCGNWTHSQKDGPAGKWTFHAGTPSAPDGTEIDYVMCSDPGTCDPSGDPPTPNRQIDFGGVGTFKNVHTAPRDWDRIVIVQESLHWFDVHVEDLGEPGNFDPPAFCPAEGHADSIGNCACPDFYTITIRATENPQSTPIYTMTGYLNQGGNFQIHYPTSGGGNCGAAATAGPDMNGDGRIDHDDLTTVLESLGKACDPGVAYCPGDANGDGMVDGEDVSEVFDYWDDRP